jgi:two-component system phosphate regulon sensor histidine kinase PhoR
VRLTQRLLFGALVVVGVQVLLMVYLVDRQLGSRLRSEAVDGLVREARVVGAHWLAGADALAIAHTDGRALGHRVTLISPSGAVVGDSETDQDGLAHLDNLASMPEVAAALAGSVGTATERRPQRTDEEVYVAVRSALGVARVSMPAFALSSAIADAQQAVMVAGVLALAAALVTAWVLARRIARPLAELRDVAHAIAEGDLGRRGPMGAPGELGDVAVSLRELSEQLVVQNAEREAHEGQLLQLTESLNEGIVGVDAARRVVRINETGRRLLGVRAALPFSVDLVPRNRALRDALEGAFSGKTTDASETVLLGRTVSVAARTLESGGAVLALLDLTRLRRLEAVRRDFVANVSHELRTPLTVVGGFAETLAHDDPPSERRRHFAERILANTKRMQRIVDDLLDLSRIESGGWLPNPVDIDLDALAADTLAAARDVASAKGVLLEAAIDPCARHVTADSTALRQVLANLVENAVRHTAAGRVVIFSRPGEGDGVEIGVRDTGTGIAAEQLPRIFERFYRVDPGRSREEGGTGLGLAIVRHLVEAHGGNVRAESVVGAGTTITVHFPPGAPTRYDSP